MGKVIDIERCADETGGVEPGVKNFPRSDRMSPRMEKIVRRYHMGKLDTAQLGDRFERNLVVFETTDSPQTQFIKGMELIDFCVEFGLINERCRASEIRSYMARQSSGRGIFQRDHTDYSTGEER